MTNEEAIHALDTLVEAYGIAIRALRAQKDSNLVEIDQVKPAKLDRSRWEGCGYCSNPEDAETNEFLFCPYCGHPITEEAWAKKKYQRVTHWMPLPEPPKEETT